jgi:hypothetical protein
MEQVVGLRQQGTTAWHYTAGLVEGFMPCCLWHARLADDATH